MAVKLSAGAVERMCKGDTEIKPVLQVTEIKLVTNSNQNPENDRYRMVVSDGTFILLGMLVTQRNDLVLSGKLQKGSTVKLAEFVCNRILGRTLIIVIDLEVVCEVCYPIGQPTQYILLPGGARPVQVQSLVAGVEAKTSSKTEEFAGAMMKLTYSNYSIWKSRMEDLLYCKDLYDPIKLGTAKPAEMSDTEREKLHRKAVGTINSMEKAGIHV